MPDTATLKTTVLERFLDYVTYDTQSDDQSSTYPSTAKQLVLLDKIAAELRAIGLEDVTLPVQPANSWPAAGIAVTV